jgi:hypothetical protein
MSCLPLISPMRRTFGPLENYNRAKRFAARRMNTSRTRATMILGSALTLSTESSFTTTNAPSFSKLLLSLPLGGMIDTSTLGALRGDYEKRNRRHSWRL